MFANGGHNQPTLVLPVNMLCDVRNDVVFTLKNLQFGTHSLFMHLVSGSDHDQKKIEWSGMVYYEVVPHLLSEAIYNPLQQQSSTVALLPFLPPSSPRRHSPYQSKTKLQIVVVGTSTMDGQKIIWLEQMARLDAKIDFTFICYVCASHDQGDFLKELKKLNVTVVLYPGFDIGRSLGLSENFPHNVLRLLHGSERNKERNSGLREENEEKQKFVDDFHSMFVSPLIGKDLLVFANSQSVNDLFLQEAALIANVATVVDLPNLNPTKGLVLIDAVVSPSSYAMNHPKNSALINNDNVRSVVIQPGVDVDLFQVARLWDDKMQQQQQQQILQKKKKKKKYHFRVGFIGRLAPEKSIGLFLRAARILELHLVKVMKELSKIKTTKMTKTKIVVEFVVVGDGPQKEAMKIISQRLGLESRVVYIGWLNHFAMSSILQSLDVVINPSLRESETFCIANIEAMASSVVVVTLGARGVGEYLNKGTNGTLGLIVRNDAPKEEWAKELAMLSATVLLDNALQNYIGMEARKVVVKSFSAEKMAQRYLSLYETVVIASRVWKQWKQRSIPSTLERAVFEMSRSEVNKLSFDVKEAESAMKEIVNTGDLFDSFANLMRGSVLGITRFPIIAHLPIASWYKMNVTIKELQTFHLLNESSWWSAYGKCPTVKSASAKYLKHLEAGNLDEHTIRLTSIQRRHGRAMAAAKERVVVGVATSWRGALDEREGVTLLDGNHRSILFSFSMLENSTVTLILGLSSKFRREWKGNFYCRERKDRKGE